MLSRKRSGPGRSPCAMNAPSITAVTTSPGMPNASIGTIDAALGAAQAAEELVGAGTEDFMARLRELAAVDVLKAYRQHAERIRDDEIVRAQRLLANGGSPEEALAQLARGLTNKLLHAPSVQLKKLSAEGRVEALGIVQELFALDTLDKA